MIKPFKNREEKIKFLNDLLEGKRKLEEIVELKDEFITYGDTVEGVVITGKYGNVLTREEAKAIRNRNRQNVMIYVTGKAGGAAYKIWEEDKSTNENSGRHLSFIPVFGNAPIVDDDSEIFY